MLLLGFRQQLVPVHRRLVDELLHLVGMLAEIANGGHALEERPEQLRSSGAVAVSWAAHGSAAANVPSYLLTETLLRPTILRRT